MAGAASQKQFLSLIREFANENSAGERRLLDLKKQLSQLQPELDAAHAELQRAKCSKEMIFQELRGSEVQAALTDASIQAHQSRISFLQEEVSNVSSDIAHIKNEVAVTRDNFIIKMLNFNKEIREFQGRTTNFWIGGEVKVGERSPSRAVKQDILEATKDKLALLREEIPLKEATCQQEQNSYHEALQELSSLEKRVFLMESIAKGTQDLQAIASQTAKMEKVYASELETLRGKYTCPSCQKNNMGEFGLTSEAE